MDDPQPEAAPRPMSLGRLMTGEIAVGIVINIAFNLFFAWLVFYGRTPVGRDAVMLDTVPAAFIPAFLMTFPITWLMRKRIDDGLTVLSAARLPFELPQKLLSRAAVIALLALALASVPTDLLLWFCWGSDWDWATIVQYKIAFSAFHAAVLTPVVLLSTLMLDHPGSVKR